MENTQLTIADLASLHSMVEAASQRGAFRANELSQVGAVYDKLSAFLAHSRNQSDDAAEQTPAQTQGQANA